MLFRHDPNEKRICQCGIEASQFPNGIQGGCPVTGKVVSDPEVIPGEAILRIDPQGLEVGLDSIIVALEAVVNAPEGFPGGGILRIDS